MCRVSPATRQDSRALHHAVAVNHVIGCEGLQARVSAGTQPGLCATGGAGRHVQRHALNSKQTAQAAITTHPLQPAQAHSVTACHGPLPPQPCTHVTCRTPPHLKPGRVALRVLVLLPHNLVVQRDALRLAPPHAVAEGAARKAAQSQSSGRRLLLDTAPSFAPSQASGSCVLKCTATSPPCTPHPTHRPPVHKLVLQRAHNLARGVVLAPLGGVRQNLPGLQQGRVESTSKWWESRAVAEAVCTMSSSACACATKRAR